MSHAKASHSNIAGLNDSAEVYPPSFCPVKTQKALFAVTKRAFSAVQISSEANSKTQRNTGLRVKANLCLSKVSHRLLCLQFNGSHIHLFTLSPLDQHGVRRLLGVLELSLKAILLGRQSLHPGECDFVLACWQSIT